MNKHIEFELLGIAQVLRRYRLRVPPNQREYRWEQAEVEKLLYDIANAMREDKGSEYFLGTIVLTRAEDDLLEVADGQQRLATTSMILAYIRDYYRRNNKSEAAHSIESDFLFKYDLRAKDILPNLTLNLDDNEFFKKAVLQVAGQGEVFQPTIRSHRLINEAVDTIGDYFKNVEEQYGEHREAILIDWLDYLSKKAIAITLQVANQASAFVMFETLNDRGIKTSQADLVKNYLFKRAGDQEKEAHQHWSRMRGALDTIGSDDDLMIDFLRLAGYLLEGATREREIMERIEANAQNKTDALQLLTFLDNLSIDYAAILNPDHPKWNPYDESVRKALRTIVQELKVTQIRPLILAISRHFTKARTAVAFRRLVAWSVRILIEGIRGGRLDGAYAQLANKIHRGKIKTNEDLFAEASKLSVIPTDARFQNQFANARVSVSRLARYYLRALENTATEEAEPEFIPNDGVAINLEHIMSNVPSDGITEQDIETHHTRIGNLALLKAKQNSVIGSKPFSEKLPAYRKSAFVLTQEVAKVETWGVQQIEERQKELAALAVRTWPIQ